MGLACGSLVFALVAMMYLGAATAGQPTSKVALRRLQQQQDTIAYPAIDTINCTVPDNQTLDDKGTLLFVATQQLLDPDVQSTLGLSQWCANSSFPRLVACVPDMGLSAGCCSFGCYQSMHLLDEDPATAQCRYQIMYALCQSKSQLPADSTARTLLGVMLQPFTGMLKRCILGYDFSCEQVLANPPMLPPSPPPVPPSPAPPQGSPAPPPPPPDGSSPGPEPGISPNPDTASPTPSPSPSPCDDGCDYASPPLPDGPPCPAPDDMPQECSCTCQAAPQPASAAPTGLTEADSGCDGCVSRRHLNSGDGAEWADDSDCSVSGCGDSTSNEQVICIRVGPDGMVRLGGHTFFVGQRLPMRNQTSQRVTRLS